MLMVGILVIIIKLIIIIFLLIHSYFNYGYYNLISKIDSFKESKIFYIDGDFGRNFPLRNDLPNLEQSLFYLFIYLFLVLEPTFEYLLR